MGRKHWEKDKLLITSNFSFSHSVLKRLVSQGHQKVSLCGNGLKRAFAVKVKMADEHSNIMISLVLNPLPDDKILDWSKLKETADDILKCI